jgi:arabinan endo-1,5-alpha-L-arabinosidase
MAKSPGVTRSIAGALLALLLASGLGTAVHAQRPKPRVLRLSGDVSPIHDPAIIREGSTYYVFATNYFAGRLLPIFCSEGLRDWTFCANVFDRVPDWALDEVPGAAGIWAPDISYTNGEFRLYYSVSTFGSNRSVIGLATNTTLDPSSPEYRWVDRGRVVGSTRADDYNAIDANVAEDADGGLWLAFGSFWSGIKMRRLDRETGMVSAADTTLYSLASRPPPQSTAIEAPFIVRKDEWYYLFVSFDLCCRGVDSTYKVMVGRSRRITGPYEDKRGRPMTEGGGSRVVRGTARWRGPGHPAVLIEPSGDLLAFHAYHGVTGAPALQISTLVWEDGWPRAGKLPR